VLIARDKRNQGQAPQRQTRRHTTTIMVVASAVGDLDHVAGSS
jgi:hypothetical protein